MVPITAGSSSIGVLVAVWGVAEADVASRVIDPLADFAQQVGIALLASRAQRDRATVLLLEDRERIARDMHDLVIQRLFATGLSLQVAGRLTEHPMVREGLANVVRHAQADSARVALSLRPTVQVQIEDDGVGIGAVTRRSGPANLRDQAVARSGRCDVTALVPRGTRISWSVPAP